MTRSPVVVFSVPSLSLLALLACGAPPGAQPPSAAKSARDAGATAKTELGDEPLEKETPPPPRKVEERTATAHVTDAERIGDEEFLCVAADDPDLLWAGYYGFEATAAATIQGAYSEAI